MFACKACLIRGMAPLVGKPFHILPRIPAILQSNVTLRRNKTTTVDFKTDTSIPTNARPKTDNKTRSRSRPSSDTYSKSDTSEKTAVGATDPATDKKAAKELEFMSDPWHVGNRVRALVEPPNGTPTEASFELAAAITRRAGKKLKVQASWNHLIGYQLRNQRIHAALKLFNEMKKRGQVPSVITYTTIFRGLANSTHSKLAVAEAVKLYHNLKSSTRTPPNTIHLNAALTVCAKAMDLESLFAIASSAGEDRARAADATTYTIILNALKADAESKRDIDPNAFEFDKKASVDAVIRQARAVWDEVLDKWRSAQIVMDDTLVTAMGRVLLLGDRRDADAVLDLVEQTTHIPRASQTIPAPKSNSAQSDDDLVSSASTQKRAQKTGFSFAKPTNRLLSLVLNTLTSSHRVLDAPYYWKIFTVDHKVVPDVGNWWELLQVYRVGKSSARAAATLAEMPEDMQKPSMFKIAMATCLADNLNHNSFANASKILKQMKKPTIADVPALRIYMRIAYAGRRSISDRTEKNAKLDNMDFGRQLLQGLDTLLDPYNAVRSQIFNTNISQLKDNKEWLTKASPVLSELAALGRKMVATYDKLIFQDMVPESAKKRLEQPRNIINSHAMEYFEERIRRDPNFDKKAARNAWKKEAEEEEASKLGGKTAAGDEELARALKERSDKSWSRMEESTAKSGRPTEKKPRHKSRRPQSSF